MATRDVFSAEELARLRGFAEITRAELIRYVTLTPADEMFLRKFHGRRNTLGASVQLCTLPWLGFVPDEVTAAPAVMVARLADQLGMPATELAGYGDREQTRTDHLREILRYAGWRVIGPPDWKELDEFLLARAMEHDSPTLLFRLACEYLRSERVVRPGVVVLLEHIASARDRARTETWLRLAHLVAEDGPGTVRRGELDGLLVVDPVLGRTPLRWLETGPTTSSSGPWGRPSAERAGGRPEQRMPDQTRGDAVGVRIPGEARTASVQNHPRRALRVSATIRIVRRRRQERVAQ